MKLRIIKSIFLYTSTLFLISAASCKKCYECTCTDNTVLNGCQELDEKIELCDKGTIGKSVLTIRIIEKEDEGYTCTLK